jgi:large subunit ribosomal protein L6
MSRVAKKPITVPSGVEVSVDGRTVAVKGPKGTVEFKVHRHVSITQENGA